MARFAMICEYNPLHAGHAYALQRARELGADEVVCILSGNYVQRGEPAVAHKYTRAEAALAAGADLVVELPFPQALASAEFFACAGVSAADALASDVLFFGSESANIELLKAGAEALCTARFKEEYARLIKTNMGTAAAFAKALEQCSLPALPTLSNDLLGLAYCKAILAGGYEIEPVCIARTGAAYNQSALGEGFPSATALRKIGREQGHAEMIGHLPDACAHIFAKAYQNGEMLGDGTAFDAAVLGILRTLPTEQFESAALCSGGLGQRIAQAALCSGGLGQRIAQAALDATSLTHLYSLCTHKSLPDAHVRRAVLYATLGMTQQDLRRTPAYLSVLAANARGRAILSELRRTCPVPLVTKPADAPACRQRELSDRADALYTLGMQNPQSAGFFTRHAPIMTE
ncbi:MAG: nucleotidyltransferase family protein [Clostridia bacterium]|nr:nucleotidyltransferase family protein [Clostridia bacterium]